jgi:hypothetical protein
MRVNDRTAIFRSIFEIKAYSVDRVLLILYQLDLLLILLRYLNTKFRLEDPFLILPFYFVL